MGMTGSHGESKMSEGDDPGWQAELPKLRCAVLMVDVVGSVSLICHPEARFVERWRRFVREVRLQVLPRSEALLQVPGTTAGGPDGLVLIGLGPTDREATLPNWEPVRAPSGYWTVTVDNRGAGALTVHAWVGRDDPDLAARSEFAQSRLVDVAGGFKVEDAGTLTGQACGAKTIVVGSRVQNDPDGLAPDSGAGPARRGSRTGPDLVAAGVRRAASVGLVGIEATANLSGGQPVRLSGTSISAPRVTRKAFEALATQGVVGGAAGLLTRWFGPAPKGGGLARDSRFGLGRLDDNGQVGPQSEDPPQRNDDLDGGTDARTPHQRAGSARASTSAGPCTAT